MFFTGKSNSPWEQKICYNPKQKAMLQQMYLIILSKLDEPDMRDSVGEVWTCLYVMYSCGPFHMDMQRQDDQLEPTYSSSVPIQDVALTFFRKQWTIGRGGERVSGISVLIAWHDDDLITQVLTIQISQ